MTYTPHTVWVPLIKPKKSPLRHRTRHIDATEYAQITANQVTLYLQDHPASTLTDVRMALGSSTFNTDRMLRRLSFGVDPVISRHRENDHAPWRYNANAVAPANGKHADAIKKCLSEFPDIPASDIFRRTGVPDIWCKLDRLQRRKEIVSTSRMTPNFCRPVNHYSLAVIGVRA